MRKSNLRHNRQHAVKLCGLLVVFSMTVAVDATAQQRLDYDTYYGNQTQADNALNRELIFGEDVEVHVELGLPMLNRSRNSVPVDPIVFRWRGVANFSQVEDSDPDQAWLDYLNEQEEIHHEFFSAENDDPGDDVTARKLVSSPQEESNMQSWIAVNLETGYEYDVELPKTVARSLHVYMREKGNTNGYAGIEEPSKGLDNKSGSNAPDSFDFEENPTSRGWSSGDDTRTRRFNNTTYPYRTMGQLGGGRTSGCSGTLVGPRHILTAAHCIWNMSSDSWVSLNGTRFRPGREGTCTGASCEPYGRFTARWYFTPAQFRAVDNNWTYDYGLIVTWGRPGNTTGWMGYVATSQNTIRNYCDKVPFGPGYLGGNCFNRGYPACGFSEAPNNCRQGWAYQDTKPCEIGSFIWTASGADGWKSNFTTNCDTSRGHSGSSVWTDRWGGSGKVVFGVVSTSACRTCRSGTSFPNRIRRVTPDVLNMISSFKAIYP